MTPFARHAASRGPNSLLPGLVAVTACAWLAVAPPVGAAEGGGGVDQDDPDSATLTVELAVTWPGTDGGVVVVDADDPSAPSAVYYEAIPAQSAPPGLDNLCLASGGPLGPGDVPWGWWYLVIAYDRATGEVLSRESVCVPLGDPAAGEPPAPPVLPRPPTIGEIWKTVGIPGPAVGVSPRREGVVGLETWLWSGGPDEIQVAVTLRGFTVFGTARRVEYRFDAGDGVRAIAPNAGDEANPGARHIFETKGNYSVATSSVWNATVTMTGPGIPAPLPVEIGTAIVTSTRPYRVVEVRSVLLP